MVYYKYWLQRYNIIYYNKQDTIIQSLIIENCIHKLITIYNTAMQYNIIQYNTIQYNIVYIVIVLLYYIIVLYCIYCYCIIVLYYCIIYLL